MLMLPDSACQLGESVLEFLQSTLEQAYKDKNGAKVSVCSIASFFLPQV